MPFGDRTGPRGFGPMTGRAAGYCAGFPIPGYANPGPGYGFGMGWGGGRGWRHWYYATGLPGWARFGPLSAPTREQQAALLEEQATLLREQLEAIEGQLSELSQKPAEKTE